MKKIVTRFAPSPTGYMHIGNLRTALYSYLLARHNNGKFIVRIEDTDRERFIPGAEKIIFDTLKIAGLNYDEGPDIGGPNAPYRQSERKEIYLKYAQQLIEQGDAYYCFCGKTENHDDQNENEFGGYNRHCRNLSADEIQRNLDAGKPFVIRQKVPLTGATTYHDHVFGDITVENETLQDIVLIKSDGYPTYNFAHVVDDHLMGVNSVLRGSEYLTSTIQYVLLYKAFGWELPEYYHLPLIMGKNADGEVSKLSKRHGAVSFADLLEQGYLPQAILNYIALLGWHPADDEREFFTLPELVTEFNADDIRKSAAIFDYDKLKWMNSKYIANLSLAEFGELARPYIEHVVTRELADYDALLTLLQPRVQILSEIPEKIEFFQVLPDFDINLLANDKKKTTLENAREILQATINTLENVENWENSVLFEKLNEIATNLNLKSMSIMWVVRLAVSGNMVTVGGATEIMEVLGKEESINRLIRTLDRLQ